MMSKDRPNYDALFCGRQPLHQTNLIQPHGVLLVVALKEWKVIQVSENITELLSLYPQDVIQQPLSAFMLPECMEEIEAKSNAKLFQHTQPLNLTFLKNGVAVTYQASIHEKEEALLIEVEFTDLLLLPSSTLTTFQTLKQILSAITAATTTREVCMLAAKEIKAYSGFDKVMIYSFDKEWNGTVVAEEKEAGMDEYLGLKFPASDIPKPARELYVKTPYRIIPNRAYVPVALYPQINSLTETFTNLSDCKLRSVAPVHLEYLKNMGIMASMSTRIIHGEQLWGLIACHHRTAKYLSFGECLAFEMISMAVSSKISSLIQQESVALKTNLQQHCQLLVAQVYLYDELSKALLKNSELLKHLLHADGVALCWNGVIHTIGLTPHQQQIKKLVAWLKKKSLSHTLHLSNLPLAFEEAVVYASEASGLLALPIQSDLGNFILAFRPEAIRNVSWGGNPNEVITFEPDSTAYHPRNSFLIWKETVRFTSTPWRDEEVSVAENFRNAIVEYTLKQNNNELKTLIEEFTFFTNFIPQLVWSARPDGWVEFFNDRWYEYTGLTPEESLGTHWTAVLHPDDVQRTLAIWQQALTSGDPYQVEYRFRDGNGKYQWFLGRGLPLLDSSGNIVKWFGSCTYIQDQKMMADILEKKVQERTYELQQTNIALEARNSELMQFASVASHDLQEPARKIHIFSTLMKEKLLLPENHAATDYLDRIIRSSHRMLQLINDLLNFSRLYGENFFTATDLNEIITGVLTDLELVIHEKRATLSIDHLPQIEAIPDQMRQVFQNLISNALKFSRQGTPPEIFITVAPVNALAIEAPENDKGAFCRITITDNGIGFDQENAEKIFTIFKRLHSREQFEGTGIGLAITKKIIEGHHGIIAAEGKKNEGARFVFVLPFQQPV